MLRDRGRVGADTSSRSGRESLGHQLARDYHGRAIGPGNRAKAQLRRKPERRCVSGLNHTVHPPLAGGGGNFQQYRQQAAAEAQSAQRRQHHQCIFRTAGAGHVFGVGQDFTVAPRCQQRHPVNAIDRRKARQQGQVGRCAVGKVALIETTGIHRVEKARDALAIDRQRRAQADRQSGVMPGSGGAHGRVPAMKSAAAAITAGSASGRRWPRPLVSSSRACGQRRR